MFVSGVGFNWFRPILLRRWDRHILSFFKKIWEDSSIFSVKKTLIYSHCILLQGDRPCINWFGQTETNSSMWTEIGLFWCGHLNHRINYRYITVPLYIRPCSKSLQYVLARCEPERHDGPDAPEEVALPHQLQQSGALWCLPRLPQGIYDLFRDIWMLFFWRHFAQFCAWR